MPAESLILLVLIAGLFFLMVNRTRRQQREVQNVQQHLTVGSRIMTTAGLLATIVAVDDATVTLETAPGQTSQWDRRAVARLVTDEVDTPEGGPWGSPTVDAEPVDAEPVDAEPLDVTPEDTAADVTTPVGTTTSPADPPGAGVTSRDAAPPDRV